MATVLTTGMVLLTSNPTTSLDLSAYSSIDSARIRWQGKDTLDQQHVTNNNSLASLSSFSIYANVPTVPSGYTFSNLLMSMTAYNLESHTVNGVAARMWSPNGSMSYNNGNTVPQYGSVSLSNTSTNPTDQGGNAEFNVSASVSENMQINASITLNYYKYLSSRNPQVLINGQLTKYTGSIGDGYTTGWQTLTGLVVGQNNSLANYCADSAWVYAEIEYTVSMRPTVATQAASGVSYTSTTINGVVSNFGGQTVTSGFEYGLTTSYGTNINKGNPTLNVPFTHNLTSLPYGTTYHYRAWATSSEGTSYGNDMTFTTLYPSLPTPVRNNPETDSKITDRRPYFDFTVPANANNSTTKYHARIRIDEYTNMNNATVIESKNSQTNWQLWNGSTWTTFPSVGVDPGSLVRVRPSNNLSLTTLYWDASSWDGNNYGTNTTLWNFRIMLSAKGLFTMVINNVEYDAYTVSVIETANGQIGQIVAEVNNYEGVNNTAIHYGDTLQLVVNDVFGNSEEYKGLIRSKVPNRALKITAITGSGILADRIITVDYASQDIGLTMQSIITTYCAPLTTNNVNTSTGIVAPVTSKDKTPLAVYEDLRRQYGIMYFVDKDWDMHVYLPNVITQSYTTVINGGEV